MIPIQIFISSVQGEFAKEREVLRDYLQTDELMSRLFRVFLFETALGSDKAPDRLYLDEVERSDIYLGLFGYEYGSEDEEGVSPTEREFDHATAYGLHRLVFIKSKVPNTERHGKMDSLIKKAQTSLVRKQFRSQEELLSELKVALIEYLDFKGILRLESFDKMPCSGANMEDLDVDWMSRFVRIARRTRSLALSEDVLPQDLLMHLKLFDRDELTNAAILLFGKDPQQFFISSMVQCAHFHGIEVAKPILSNHKYSGTVFHLVDQAVEYVLSRIDKRIGTRSENAIAPRTFEIPVEVVAEAIVNAVVHRDYASNASVQVMLFADRLEVWNPGRLSPKLTLQKLREPHESYPGNPLLAHPMYLAKFIERLGTGTVDMIERCVEAGLPEPEFESSSNFVVRIWRPERPTDPGVATRSSLGQAWVKPGSSIKTRHHKSLKEKEYIEFLSQGQARDKPGSSLGQAKLTGSMVAMLEKCATEVSTRGELLQATGFSKRSGGIQRQLKSLLEMNLLELTIPDKPTSPLQKYRLTEKGKMLLDKLNSN